MKVKNLFRFTEFNCDSEESKQTPITMELRPTFKACRCSNCLSPRRFRLKLLNIKVSARFKVAKKSSQDCNISGGKQKLIVEIKTNRYMRGTSCISWYSTPRSRGRRGERVGRRAELLFNTTFSGKFWVKGWRLCVQVWVRDDLGFAEVMLFVGCLCIFGSYDWKFGINWPRKLISPNETKLNYVFFKGFGWWIPF